MGLHESWWFVAALTIAFWAAVARFARWIIAADIREGDLDAALLYRLLQVYVRLFHRLRLSGAEHIPVGQPRTRPPGPLIVVANHTAGVDPLLIQAAVPYEIRWIMAQDMRAPALERLWRYTDIIFIDRQNRDSRGVREALRHLKAGGVIGLFPEGHIERPAEQLMVFEEGVGVLIARSGAPVLPVVIEGTPQVDPAWESLTRPSRSSVRFLPLWRPTPEEADAPAAALRALFQRATGWPLNERRAVFRDGEWWYLFPDGREALASEIENRASSRRPRYPCSPAFPEPSTASSRTRR